MDKVMPRLRIAHCLETVGSGGVEQLKLIKARGLDPARYEQVLICTQAIGGLPAQFRDAGCAIHEIGLFRGIFDRTRYARALQVVRAFRPHIIHGAVYEGVAVAALVGRAAGVPVIMGEETSDPVNRRRRGNLLYRGLAGLTHHMVAVSPAVQRYLVNRIHVPARKVTLINNGVAEAAPVSAEQRRTLRAGLGIASNDLVIGSCGRLLDSHKRFSDLLRAFATLQTQVPHAHLVIVGEGPDEGALRQLAAHLQIADRVYFTGYQANPRPMYAAMDVFALASAHEAFGLVLVEAMLAGLPVVATRVGGIPDVVAEGVSGRLVPASTPESLADALLGLLQSPALRAQFGAAGLARAREQFGADRYVREFDQLYQRLANGRVHL